MVIPKKKKLRNLGIPLKLKAMQDKNVFISKLLEQNFCKKYKITSIVFIQD